MQREYCHLTCYAIYRDRNVTKIWKKNLSIPSSGKNSNLADDMASRP